MGGLYTKEVEGMGLRWRPKFRYSQNESRGLDSKTVHDIDCTQKKRVTVLLYNQYTSTSISLSPAEV